MRNEIVKILSKIGLIPRVKTILPKTGNASLHLLVARRLVSVWPGQTRASPITSYINIEAIVITTSLENT